MWKDIFSFAQTIFLLAKEQTQIRADLKDLQNQFTHLVLRMQVLNDQVVMHEERQKAEIALLKKELEIEVLKIRQELNLQANSGTKQLPPSQPS